MAKKHLGQNFLQDENIIQEIINAADLSEKDYILEVGPGKGALTEKLLQSGAHVEAIEIDKDLIPFLKINWKKYENFSLVHGDALQIEAPTVPYKVVANLPYYITSPLINHYLKDQFINGKRPADLLVIMIQREVAEKIMARKNKHSILSMQVHIFGIPELVCEVPASAFKPAPKVQSAVIKIRVRDKIPITGNIKTFFWLLQMGFAQKRKKLSNNLANAFRTNSQEMKVILQDCGFTENIRAEDLSISDWDKLLSHLEEKGLTRDAAH